MLEGGLKVEIFNITSLTSGDYCKSSSASDDWPKSYARNPASTTPIKYGNISETFNLFIPNPPVLQPVSTPAGGW